MSPRCPEWVLVLSASGVAERQAAADEVVVERRSWGAVNLKPGSKFLLCCRSHARRCSVHLRSASPARRTCSLSKNRIPTRTGTSVHLPPCHHRQDHPATATPELVCRSATANPRTRRSQPQELKIPKS